MLWDIALEWGENTVRLVTREKGIVLAAPSWGAFREGKIIALGDEALDMLGRVPPSVTLATPIKNGMFGDIRLIGQWMSQLLEPFVSAARLIKPNVVFLDNGQMRPSERDLLLNTALELGAGQCGLLNTGAAAAAGAGLDLRRPDGFLIADIGAGQMTVSLISYGRTVLCRRLPFGMNRVDSDIIALVREKEGLSIGPRTAEDLKMALASALPAREITAAATGLDHRTGFPGDREISAALVKPAVDQIVDALTMAVRQVILEAPEELSADILKNGMVLVGGGALLSGLDKVLAERCGVETHLPETPSLCSAKGMMRILQDQELAERMVNPL